MAAETALAGLRDQLINGGDSDHQRAALQNLWMNDHPLTISIMAEALKSDQVHIKHEIIDYLSKKDDIEVYDHLIEVLDQGDESTREIMLETFERLNLHSRYLEKFDELRHDGLRYPLLARIIQFLGKVGDKKLIPDLANLIFVNNNQVQLAVLDALELTDDGSAGLGPLLSALKMAGNEVFSRAIKIIGNWKNPTSVLPLFYMFVEASGFKFSRLTIALKQFDYGFLSKSVIENIGAPNEEYDEHLLNAWILYLEQVGRIDEARSFRQKYRIGSDRQAVAASGAHAREALSCDIKEEGSFATLTLDGVLDLYTLPSFETQVRTVIKDGYTCLIMDCSNLKEIDRQSLDYLKKTNRRLKDLLGGFKLVKFTCFTDSEKKTRLPNVEFYKSLAPAKESLKKKKTAKTLPVDDQMLKPGNMVELLYSAGGIKKNREGKIRSLDPGRITIDWPVLDVTDAFDKYVDRSIKMRLTVDNKLLEADTSVRDQSSESTLTISRPSAARVIEQWDDIRLDCNFSVSCMKILNPATQKLSPKFAGLCHLLSERGMELVTPTPLKKGMHIVVIFHPAELKVARLIGSVVRVTEMVKNRKKLFKCWITYAMIFNADRMKIKEVIYSRISEEAGSL